MQARLLHQADDRLRSFMLAIGKGEDPVETLTQFAQENELGGSQITAIGAFEHAVLGYFDRGRKDYTRIPVDEQAEVLSMIGDIAHHRDRAIVHVHAVLGLKDGSTRGGHLLSARVWPTLEVIVQEWPRHLCKHFDAEVGLPLLGS